MRGTPHDQPSVRRRAAALPRLPEPLAVPDRTRRRRARRRGADRRRRRAATRPAARHPSALLDVLLARRTRRPRPLRLALPRRPLLLVAAPRATRRLGAD